VVLVAFQPILTLAVLLLSLPHLVVQFQHQRESWAIHDWEVPEVRKMHYFSSVLTSRYDAKEIRMFGLGEYFFGRYMDKFNAFHERHSKLRSTQWRTNVILAAVAAAGIAGAYAYVLYCALGGYISLGSLTLYLTAASQVENSLQSIIWSASMMYEGNLFANDLFKFTDLKPSMVVAPPELAHKLDGKLKEGIEFRDVAFKYPDNERSVLKGLSFTLKKGQTIALVGENGAGKTTIVKLLSRLYDPSEGQIFIDGVDLREYDVEDWRGHMAVVFQDFSHYHMTAKENIGVGKVKNMADLEAVRLAAEQGGALTVVERLDHGFETLLGRWYGGEDGGADLSGGEWQKIALARAFMRSSAKTGSGDGNGHSGGAPVPLLILDEPTAALDAKAEYEVYMRFHELTAGKTTILISHRFSTVRMADHILVLDGGQIIESGNHEELMAKGAEYARMYNLQADRYR
jgi:ATP-binding cassette subfamily B protein